MFSLLRRKLLGNYNFVLRHQQALVVSPVLTRTQFHEVSLAKNIQYDRRNIPSYNSVFKYTILKSTKNSILYKRDHQGGISKQMFSRYIDKIYAELTNTDVGEVAFALGLCSEYILNSTRKERIQLFDKTWKKFLFMGYDIRHYNAMVDVLGRNKTPLRLKELTDLLSINKLLPTDETFYLLLRGVCIKGDMDEANAIIKVMKSRNIPRALPMSSLIIGNCVAGNFGQAKKIASKATKKDWGQKQLFFGYVEIGNIDKVVELLEGDCVIDPASLCNGLVRIVKNFGENAAQPLYKFIPEKQVELQRIIDSLQIMGAYKTIFEVMKRMKINVSNKCYVGCLNYTCKTALDNAEELKYYLTILLAHTNKNSAPFQILNALVEKEISRQQLSDVDFIGVLQKFSRYKRQNFHPSKGCTSKLESLNPDFILKFHKKYKLPANDKEKVKQHVTLFLNSQKNIEINGFKSYSDIAPLDILRWSGNCKEIEMFYPTYWNDNVSLFSYLMLILAKEDYQHIKKLILDKEKFVKLLAQLDLGYVLAERNLDPELGLLLEQYVNKENVTFKKFTVLMGAKRYDDAKNLLRNETVVISEPILMNFLKTCPDLDAKKEVILTLRSDLPAGALLHFIKSVVSSRHRTDIIEEMVPLVESEKYMFTDKEKIIMMDFLLKNGKKCDYAHHYLTEEALQFHDRIHKNDITMESAFDLLSQMNIDSIKVIKFSALDDLLITKSKPEDLKMWVEKIMQLIPSYDLSRLMNKKRMKDFMLQNKLYGLFEEHDYSFIKLLNDTPMTDLEDIVVVQPLDLMLTMKYSLKDEHLQDKLIELMLLSDNNSKILQQLFLACINYNIDISPENAGKIITKFGDSEVKTHLKYATERFLGNASVYSADEGFQSYCNLRSVFRMKFVPFGTLSLYAKACLNGMHDASEETMGTLMNCYKTLISDKGYVENNGIYPLIIEQCLMKNGGVSMIFDKKTKE